MKASQNLDRELWREKNGDYYSDSIHVTQGGGIGINCGGTVIVRKPSEWHALAMQDCDKQPGPEPEPVVVRDFLIETLRSAPVEITFNEAGYRQMSLGKACHDAAARIEALELELKAAQANQCDGGGSVEFQGILASNGQPVTLCRKCNKWRTSPCA